MDENSWNDRLSVIETWWTILRQAHDGSTEVRQQALECLVERYGSAVRRYLFAIVHDEHVADELFQQFTETLITGKYHKASPSKGKFRSYLKKSLGWLISNYYRAQKKEHQLPEGFDMEDPSANLLSEEQEQEIWQKELIGRALSALQSEEEREKRKRYLYSVLRLRLDHPKMTAEKMFESFQPLVGARENPDAWIRKRLHLARERFTEVLIEEIAQMLAEPSIEAVEEELVELGLQPYCQHFLDRLR